MTPDELEAKAVEAQAQWGDYGIKAEDDAQAASAKLCIQIETVMRVNQKLSAAVEQLGMRLLSVVKLVSELEARVPPVSKIIL